jgi:hypothetical protein
MPLYLECFCTSKTPIFSLMGRVLSIHLCKISPSQPPLQDFSLSASLHGHHWGSQASRCTAPSKAQWGTTLSRLASHILNGQEATSLQAKPSLCGVHESFSTGHRSQLLSHSPIFLAMVQPGWEYVMLFPGTCWQMGATPFSELWRVYQLPSLPRPQPLSQKHCQCLRNTALLSPEHLGLSFRTMACTPDAGDQRNLNCLTLLFSHTVSKVVTYRLDLTHRGVFFVLNIVGSFVFPQNQCFNNLEISCIFC